MSVQFDVQVPPREQGGESGKLWKQIPTDWQQAKGRAFSSPPITHPAGD